MYLVFLPPKLSQDYSYKIFFFKTEIHTEGETRKGDNGNRRLETVKLRDSIIASAELQS